MSSKLRKLQGKPRVADADFHWKDFYVRRGYAYGMDDSGNMFVSPGRHAHDGGLFIWIAQDSPVTCRKTEEIRGHYSGCLCSAPDTELRMGCKYKYKAKNPPISYASRGGSRVIVTRAGYYGTEWGLKWTPSSIPLDSPLARRIIEAKKKSAAKCESRPYSGLCQMLPAGF